MSVENHRRAAGSSPVGFAILTVSDSRTLANDEGGALLMRLVESAGHSVACREIVADEIEPIRRAISSALQMEAVGCVLATGGTGVSPRDVTVEAARFLFEKELPGFGELFRALSFAEIGAAAMLSRSCGGIAEGKALFLLPGSPAALTLALNRLILPELRHLLTLAAHR
jgi:molybdenum cofactor biosynthesis protein B